MIRTWLLIVGALATIGFATIVLIVLPQIVVFEVQAPAELPRYTSSELRGQEIYRREGCVYCHSQQVRDPAFTTDVERGWGSRATVPGDYVYDRPHYLGTMRTGPDLINVGQRLPDPDWHLVHFYQPRALNRWSIMPAYRFLFREVDPRDLRPNDRVVRVPPEWVSEGKVVVATPDVLALTDYMISLRRQYPVPLIAGAVCRSPWDSDGRSLVTMP